MHFYANYVSTSVFGDGDYYQAMFEAEQDADDPHSPYLSIQRQFEDQSDDLCYIEAHDENYCGHFFLRRLTLRHSSYRLSSIALTDSKFADLYGSFSVKWFFGLCRFLVWSGKAVPRPVACDQVRGARGKVSRDRNASAV